VTEPDWLRDMLAPAAEHPDNEQPQPDEPVAPTIPSGPRQPGPGDPGEAWFRGVLGLDPNDKSRIE
jgi:hypothetical protein